MQIQHPRFVGFVSRPKLSGSGRHAGVLLPNGSVAHMTREDAAIVSVEDFRQGRDIRFDKAAPVECHHQIQWRPPIGRPRAALRPVELQL